MKFFMPVNTFYGKDCLLENGSKINGLGKKALIVTGENSAIKSGALDDLLSVLANEYIVFNEVSENPTMTIVVKGVNIFRENDCDYIIGIGGGSPIDTAKAISVLAANKSVDIYNLPENHRAYPIVAIPTTSGTGTEVTPYSVITNPITQKKAGFASAQIFPKLSFLDPKYTFSLSSKVTLDSAIDALSHLLEGIYSINRSPILYPFIFSGVNVIYSTLSYTIENPGEYNLRNQLMCASFYGGMVIAQSGTTLQHGIGYPLTTQLGLSHGLANGVVMKEIMELFYPSVKNEIDLLFTGLGISKSQFYDWLEQIGMKSNLKLSDSFIEKYAPEIAASGNMRSNPLEVKIESIKTILKNL